MKRLLLALLVPFLALAQAPIQRTPFTTNVTAGPIVSPASVQTDSLHAVTQTTTHDLAITNSTDWIGGNVIYVPTNGVIQTYVTAANAGDTLILGSGVYTITSPIIIPKALNVVGQGSAGFVTAPVTASHGTLITSATAAHAAFQLNANNIRISDLSINMTGASATGVNTTTNVTGLVFRNIDVIVASATGRAQGFVIKGSDAILRDLTFNVTSGNDSVVGVYFWNDATCISNNIVEVFNVTGTVDGGANWAYCFDCEGWGGTKSLTLNLDMCRGVSLTGTAEDVAVASITSAGADHCTVNGYHCTFDGADYDVKQSGANVLALGGSLVVNERISGTPTYRTTLASGNAVIGGQLVLRAGSITNLGDNISFGTNTIWTYGKLGVGTNTPIARLAVNGAPTGVSFAVNTNQLVVTNGLVGIGLDTPPYPLSMYVPAAGAVIALDNPTATAGNARGQGAVDFQYGRNAATKVASGINSTIVGGTNCTASGSYSVAGGSASIASGAFSTAFSGPGTASGQSSSSLGGSASGIYSFTQGTLTRASSSYAQSTGGNAVSSHYGEFSRANGSFTATYEGEAQWSVMVGRRTTQIAATSGSGITNAWNTIFLDGDTSAQRMTIPYLAGLQTNSVWTFKAQIAMVATTNYAGTVVGYGGGYTIEGVIKRRINTTSLIGVPVVTTLGEDNAAWDVRASADDTNDCLLLEYFPENDCVRAVATVSIAQVFIGP
jgi:hypothetical protein